MAQFFSGNVIIGMLVDLDKRFIQYWVSGRHQPCCLPIFSPKEAKVQGLVRLRRNAYFEADDSEFYVAVTLFYNYNTKEDSVEIRRVPQYPLESLQPFENITIPV